MPPISRSSLRRVHRMVPGAIAVNLTIGPNNQDGMPPPVTYLVPFVRKNHTEHGAIQFGEGFGTDERAVVFVLAADDLPAGVVPVPGDWVTDYIGVWSIVRVSHDLLDSAYACTCRLVNANANITIPTVPLTPTPIDPPPSPPPPPPPDTTAPAVSIIPVQPDPRDQAVSGVVFQFSEPVSGFTVDDLTLKRDGGTNLLTTETLTTVDMATYTLADLTAVTGTAGTYVLTLTAAGSGIRDAAGNVLAGDASETWVFSVAPPADTTPPTAAITPVAPDPHSTSITTLTIVFSEPVIGFGLSDLVLTRNGGPNLLTGSQTLSSPDSQVWTLGNLAGLTNTPGTYTLVLTAAGSGIQDAAGNAMVANASESWQLVPPAPPVPNPDPITGLPTFHHSDARLSFLGAATSRWLELLPGPYYVWGSNLLVHHTQATITNYQTGADNARSKLLTLIDKFRVQMPNSLHGSYISASGVGTYEMLLSGATALDGRRVYPAPFLIYDAGTMAARVFPGPKPLESPYVMSQDTLAKRHFWADRIVAEMLARYPSFYPHYWRGDEQAFSGEFGVSEGIPAWADLCADYFGRIKDQLNSAGMLAACNVSCWLSTAFTATHADQAIAALDMIQFEKLGDAGHQTTANLPNIYARLRQMLAGGMAVWLVPGVDSNPDASLHQNSRTLTVVAAGPGTPSGINLTFASPHRLANTTIKLAAFQNLGPAFGAGNYPVSVVDANTIRVSGVTWPGSITLTSSSRTIFTFADWDLACAIAMIARQAGDAIYVLHDPGFGDLECWRWPTIYGQRSGDFYGVLSSGGFVTEYRCNFTGGTAGSKTLVVHPAQGERYVEWL